MTRPLRLFWSRGHGKHDASQRNAGDWYSPLLCERLSGRPVLYADPKSCDLVAAGSILHRLRKSHWLHRLGLSRSLDIWGTGSIRPQPLPGQHRVHAVRGKLTQGLLQGSAQAALGDPGLLAELLLERPQPKQFALGVIPHYVDAANPGIQQWTASSANTCLISIFTPIPELLAMISRCETIVSSSLHGLIFADALGIPNRWLQLGALIGGEHKFLDYYSIYNLTPSALRLDDLQRLPATQIADDYHRPGIAAIKQRLLATFPLR